MKRNHLNREETLTALFRKIRTASSQFLAEELVEEELPTAATLARELDLRLVEVKKRLQTLRDEDLIQVLGVNPKRYRTNAWRLKSAEKDADYEFSFLFVESEALETNSESEPEKEWWEY